MKVRCVYNDLAELPVATRARLSESIRLEGSIPGLEKGRVYPVLGVVQWSNGLQFLVNLHGTLTYPIPAPAELFEVIDSSCSNDWMVGLRPEEGKWTFDQIGFREFVEDSAFMEKLMDNDPIAVAAYRRRVAEVEGGS